IAGYGPGARQSVDDDKAAPTLIVALLPLLPWAAFVLDLDPEAGPAHAGADDEPAPGQARVAVQDRVGGELGQARERVRGERAVTQDLRHEPPRFTHPL